MSKIDISTRVIAVCDNLLMVTNDKEATLANGFEELAFIVDKNTIEGGTVEEIRNKLSAFVTNKYIVCKY